jgi:putative ABC transport system ATP-binding protein
VSGTPPVVEALDLWKSYPGGESPVLRGLSLTLAPGQAAAIYGRSGSGKTTLLNVLAGLDPPDRGRVLLEGRDLVRIGEEERTAIRRRRLGFVFQFFNLLPTLTAFENVHLALELIGRPDPARTRDALAGVGLEGKAARFPNQLSGGEQQRVAIARALVKEPALILADEPTGNLDSGTADLVMDLLTALCRRRGTTLLLATHSPRAGRWTDLLLSMEDGILREGIRP